MLSFGFLDLPKTVPWFLGHLACFETDLQQFGLLFNRSDVFWETVAEASLNHISIRANANCNFKTQTAIIFKSGALMVLLVSKQASF